MCIPGFICVSYYLNRLFLYTIKGVFYDQMKNGMMKMLGMRDYIVYSKCFGYEYVFCADTSPVGSTSTGMHKNRLYSVWWHFEHNSNYHCEK